MMKAIAALLVGVFAVASATTVLANDAKKDEAKKETKK
jgi:hypothetical protein